jgi:hypothetical protein
MTAEISIRLSWLPDGATGHILLHRQMPGPAGHGALDEYWRSGPVGELAAARLELTAGSTADWQQLLCGLPLGNVTMPATPHPIVLHRLDRDALRAVLAVADSASDIAGASLRFTEAGGVLDPAGGRLDRNRFEPVALGIAPFLRRTLDDLALARSTGTPAPAAEAPSPGDELRAGLASAIRLHDTRGVQIGDHNVQVNRFVVRGPHLTLDFDDVLRNTTVQTAMSALLANPGNSDLRRGLVGALHNVDQRWSVTAQPLTLSAQSRPPGLLTRLLSFDVQGRQDVRGVQVGNDNTQHNTFHYTVSDSPKVSALLRQDLDLAQQLADYLCPATGGVGALTTLRRQVDQSVQGLGITFDRDVNQQLTFPEPGNTLHIVRADGVTVGDHNVIKSTHDVDLVVRTLQPVHPADLSPAAPTMEPPKVDEPQIPDHSVRAPSIDIGGFW